MSQLHGDVVLEYIQLPNFFTATVVPLLAHVGSDNIKLLRGTYTHSS